MPVTKTAKRALRGSMAKAKVNTIVIGKLEVAVRHARKTKVAKEIIKAISLADRAVKKRVIHKNKAARIKSQLAKLNKETTPKKESTKKVSKKK